MYKFRNSTFNDSTPECVELTPMQKSFSCDLTLTASISGTTFLILNAIYGQKVFAEDFCSLKHGPNLLFSLVLFLGVIAFTHARDSMRDIGDIFCYHCICGSKH